ncbi:hypothetical protein F4808DRAFT_23037 [Astrocystis sublimbata]|nr:hypothetical protein F4808DRAFT_23037 [Astrocystis sublimbata]
MDNPPASDQSLLERLNALKPSSVSLANPHTSKPDAASTIDRAKTPSKEDALTARLKSLRNQGGESLSSTGTSREHGAKEPTQTPATQDDGSVKEGSGVPQASKPIEATDEVDSLLYTDDQTLEELLADLRSDESWLDGVAAEEEEHQRVTALLAELSKPSTEGEKADGSNSDHDNSQVNREDSSDDESEDIAETEAEAGSVLAKTLDEVEWEEANKDPSPRPQPEGAKQISSDMAHKTPDDDPFDLPTVPSELQDQPGLPTPSTQNQSDVDFAASIESRMAALKLSGTRELPSAPADAVDSLGLPQAPTFAPSDRPVPGIAKRTGLTDDDQKNWCVVCLEDGTVRCLGCEDGDNVYCARCWKGMHVGPQAGYEERGHSWATFVQRPR